LFTTLTDRLSRELDLKVEVENNIKNQKLIKKEWIILWQLLDQCLIAAQAINLTGGISSREHELCNSQENSIGNHNSILLTIYISVLGPYYDFSMPILMSISCSHVLLLIHYVFTLRLVCHIYVPWCHTLNPTLNLCHPYVYYVYTMRNHIP